jgi:hypothetical protein
MVRFPPIGGKDENHKDIHSQPQRFDERIHQRHTQREVKVEANVQRFKSSKLLNTHEHNMSPCLSLLSLCCCRSLRRSLCRCFCPWSLCRFLCVVVLFFAFIVERYWSQSCFALKDTTPHHTAAELANAIQPVATSRSSPTPPPLPQSYSFFLWSSHTFMLKLKFG